ncbi:MAG: glycosyltransferase family 9 protein [Chloroflexota bacterium]|nr:glycosyltransferase family 9 protein [Chloroflexota bacterium]
MIVKLADLGDAVLLTAAVDAAHRHLPQYDLDLLLGTAGAPVFVSDPRVRKLWAFDRKLLEGRRAARPSSLLAWGRLLWALRRERYDALVLAHHLTTLLGSLKLASLVVVVGARLSVGVDNGRGTFLNRRYPDSGFGAVCEGEYWVRLVGQLATEVGKARGNDPGGSVRGTLSLSVSDEARERATRLLGMLPRGPLFAIHHGLGGWIPSRSWRPAGYAEVARRVLAEVGGTVLLLGGPEERAAAQEVAHLVGERAVVLAGETDVQLLVALLARCDVYLGPDSGLTHIAMAVRTPVVSLWGPTNEAAWGPCAEIGSGPATVLRAPDRPLNWVYVGHRMGDLRHRTDLGALDPAVVARAVLQMLERKDFG